MYNNNTVHPHMIILFGPTGVGKSDVALDIAEQLPVEIVNIDVGQFYLPLSIGTAKPNWREQKVPHHLFDIINEPIDYTAFDYRERFNKIAAEIWKRNNIPLVVGGSCFYIYSLFFPPHQGIQGAEMRMSEEYFDAFQQDQLWQKLYDIDPARAQQIHPNDVYRVKRALAIWRVTGKKPSSFIPTYDPVADYTLICLTREREELYHRINKRTEIMIQNGWIEEARKLEGTEWEQFIRRKKLIGYPELFDYLEGKRDLKETTSCIQQATRNYAKRQLVFWRRLKRQLFNQSLMPNTSIETINLTSINFERYINLLSKRVISLVS